MKAYEVLSDSTKWTQGAMCKDAQGRTMSEAEVNSDRAASWCAAGAIAKAYPRTRARMAAIRKLNRAVGSNTQWNDADGQTWDVVRAKLQELDI